MSGGWKAQVVFFQEEQAEVVRFAHTDQLLLNAGTCILYQHLHLDQRKVCHLAEPQERL